MQGRPSPSRVLCYEYTGDDSFGLPSKPDWKEQCYRPPALASGQGYVCGPGDGVEGSGVGRYKSDALLNLCRVWQYSGMKRIAFLLLIVTLISGVIPTSTASAFWSGMLLRSQPLPNDARQFALPLSSITAHPGQSWYFPIITRHDMHTQCMNVGSDQVFPGDGFLTGGIQWVDVPMIHGVPHQIGIEVDIFKTARGAQDSYAWLSDPASYTEQLQIYKDGILPAPSRVIYGRSVSGGTPYTTANALWRQSNIVVDIQSETRSTKPVVFNATMHDALRLARIMWTHVATLEGGGAYRPMSPSATTINPPSSTFFFPDLGTYRYPVYTEYVHGVREYWWHTLRPTEFAGNVAADYHVFEEPNPRSAQKDNANFRHQLGECFSSIATVQSINYAGNPLGVPTLQSWGVYLPFIHSLVFAHSMAARERLW